MVAHIAKDKFKVPKVLVRILDPDKESFCRIIGIESICTTTIAAEKIIAELNKKYKV